MLLEDGHKKPPATTSTQAIYKGNSTASSQRHQVDGHQCF